MKLTQFSLEFFLQNYNVQSMDISEFDAVQRYIQDYGTIYPVVEGRITMLNPPVLHTDSKPNENDASRLTVSMFIMLLTTVSLLNYFK